MKLNGFRSQCQITGQHPAKGAMRQDKVVPLRRMNEALRPGPLLFTDPGLAPLECRRLVYEGKKTQLFDIVSSRFESVGLTKAQYNAHGVVDTRPDIQDADWVADNLVVVKVRWPYLDAMGREMMSALYPQPESDAAALYARIFLRAIGCDAPRRRGLRATHPRQRARGSSARR